MTREQVWENATSFLVREFGRLLEVRDVRRIRRVMGEGWMVTVVLHATSGELHVADVVVDESGAMSPPITADAIVPAVKRKLTETLPPPSEDMGDLDGFGGGRRSRSSTPTGCARSVCGVPRTSLPCSRGSAEGHSGFGTGRLRRLCRSATAESYVRLARNLVLRCRIPGGV